MRGVNRVTILGTVGRDPEVRTVGQNTCTTLSVATSESWKDKNTGQATEQTEWHRIVLWGRQAEIAAEYLRKGSKAYFEGKLQTRKWQDKDGQDRYLTEIVASAIQLLDSNNSQQREQQQPDQRGGDGQRGRPNTPPARPVSNDLDDDLPF